MLVSLRGWRNRTPATCISTFSMLLTLSLVCSAEIPGGHNCTRAQRPNLPNGDNTTEQELIQSKQILQNYLAESDKYLTCLKAHENSFGDEIDPALRAAIIIEHNSVVDEMYLAGDEFNIALRKFGRSGDL